MERRKGVEIERRAESLNTVFWTIQDRETAQRVEEC
jgi:hypothetical protein